MFIAKLTSNDKQKDSALAQEIQKEISTDIIDRLKNIAAQ